MKRLLSLYPYVAPLILTPLACWLWRREYAGNVPLTLAALLIPILWAYVVPGIGTNVLKVWEFDTRLRLGRFRPHHGFVFGSATAMLAWLVHGFPWFPLTCALLLFAVNTLYDVKALQAGILRVYNQPWADGKGEAAVALDYAPWFFGGFGVVYGAGLGVLERIDPSRLLPAALVVLVLAMVVPVAGYALQSRLRHGHWGMRPVPGVRWRQPPPWECSGASHRFLLGSTRRKRQLSLPHSIRGGFATALLDETARVQEPLNWLLLVVALVATSACLWLASHAVWWLALAACVAFAFVNNLPFALMHEAVHGLAARTSRRNAVFGILASAMFPTSFSLQRVAHLGHHARNRTDSDLYDYYLPAQSRWMRNVWLYAGNLLGLYWFCIPLSNALYLLATPLYRSRAFVERVAPRLGFGPHVRDIAALPPLRVWVEIAGAFAFQAALWWALALEWKGWLLAHWLFALHWSALQYVDHAWSRRDVAEGAWNLRVLAPVRWLALNYHYHRVHHANPAVPWTGLPQLAGPSAAEPSFWQIYASLWRHGVQPAPPMSAPAARELF